MAQVLLTNLESLLFWKHFAPHSVPEVASPQTNGFWKLVQRGYSLQFESFPLSNLPSIPIKDPAQENLLKSEVYSLLDVEGYTSGTKGTGGKSFFIPGTF